jgi:hypothetical protein
MSRPDIYFKATMILQCASYRCKRTEEAEGIICLTQETDIDTVPLYSLEVSSVDQSEIPEGWTGHGSSHYCPVHKESKGKFG